jgi:hypothetical protein
MLEIAPARSGPLKDKQGQEVMVAREEEEDETKV